MPQLDDLLSCLENDHSRAEAVKTLHELADLLGAVPVSDAGLSIHNASVPELAEPIRLILHSAVFSPEYWGRTFAEGLLKDPGIFGNKRIVELGTGSGWISLLLLNRTEAQEILGLDINPVAVVIANLNKWLNGTYADGTLRLSRAGVPIVKAFRAEVSDLLSQPLARGERFDHVIGCIPQVLHPDAERTDSAQGELSYRDLYDLSNYCFNQGILEDRFGLPLIARALEEAQLCLNHQGLLTLILGGRPGQMAIEQMFRRRGYLPNLWWMRRIQQSDDTDLAQLVNLELAHDIKFHFFSSNSSRYSIPASTAVELQKRGRKVFHDLLVYQAVTQYEKPTLDFIRNLHALGLDVLRKELDFSRISEEQISFLSRITTDLLQQKTLPYPHERGDRLVRDKLAKFLAVYCYYSSSADQLFIGPERSQLLAMILSMVSQPGDKLLLSGSLSELYAETVVRQGLTAICGNEDLADLLDMDQTFEPKIVLLSPYQLKDPSPLLLQTLVQQAEAHPERWYVVDDSEHFDIGSGLQSNLMVRLIGQRQLPSNLIFLYGLIKNTVCPDFELSFLINAPKQWIDGLEVCAELSYSRISYVVQLYYAWLFDELLSFPFANENEQEKSETGRKESSGLLTERFHEISRDPVFAPKPVDPETIDCIRFDYGEFEFPIPDLLVKGLIKGFIESPAGGIVDIMRSRVGSYLRKTRGSEVDPSRIVLAQGVFPLFGALIHGLKMHLGRSPIIVLPRASYGPLFPMLAYFGAQSHLVDTDPTKSFLIDAEQIAGLSCKPDLIWLTQPGNPSGIYMDADEVRRILSVCADRGIYLLADEIFYLLSDLKLGAWTPTNLSFGSTNNLEHRKWLFYVDGLSKAFAAGGLRCGFMACPNVSWANKIGSLVPLPSQSTLRAWDNFYSAFLEKSPHQLIDVDREYLEIEGYLTAARQLLSTQRNQVLDLLSRYELADSQHSAKRGGLFVMAQLDDHILGLAKEQKLLLNPSAWGRMEPWVRLCFSLQPDKFEEGFNRLSSYLESKFK